SVKRSRPSSFMRSLAGVDDQIEILLDGERVHVFPAGADGSVKLSISAGPHTLAAAFIRKQQGYRVNGSYDGFYANTRVNELSINGPLGIARRGGTPRQIGRASWRGRVG